MMILKNVEIILKQNSDISENKVITAVKSYLYKQSKTESGIISHFDCIEHQILYENVDNLIIDGSQDADVNYTNISTLNTKYFVYKLDSVGPQNELCENDENGVINIATVCELPTKIYSGLWESLIYDNQIKDNLLKYAQTTVLFSERNVNTNLISCNRVILLHGPPGTGKTSLCQALSQKLSIRLKSKYKKAILVEINSHSLFSKWFSESGKLVAKMFSQIKDFVEDPNFLVCILIDEVESLAHAREKCMSGNEPSDSIRVVNALLTELDKIKIHPNVLILATSNVTGAIDLAFIDRADIKQYIGPPGVEAIYQIYYSCIQELLKKEIIQPKVAILQCPKLVELENNVTYDASKKLLQISEASVGLSGRTLRKLPFIAHALFTDTEIVTLDSFLKALLLAAGYQKNNSKYF